MTETQTVSENKTSKEVFTYSLHKKFFAVMVYLLFLFFGIFCIYLGNLFTIVLGILLIFAAFINILNVFLFRSLIIEGAFLIKQWYFFGNKKIAIDDLMAYNGKKIWKNTITFLSKNGSAKLNFCMNLECFLLKKATFEDVKNLLIYKNIITGDEKCWDTKKKVNLFKRIFK